MHIPQVNHYKWVGTWTHLLNPSEAQHIIWLLFQSIFLSCIFLYTFKRSFQCFMRFRASGWYEYGCVPVVRPSLQSESLDLKQVKEHVAEGYPPKKDVPSTLSLRASSAVHFDSYQSIKLTHPWTSSDIFHLCPLVIETYHKMWVCTEHWTPKKFIMVAGPQILIWYVSLSGAYDFNTTSKIFSTSCPQYYWYDVILSSVSSTWLL